MLKKELIDLVAGKMNFSKVQSKEVIELILNTIYESAAADGECLVGDHRFKLKKVAERQGLESRNRPRRSENLGGTG